MRGFSTKLDRRNCLTLPACVVHLHILVRSLAGVAKDGAVHGDVAPGLVAASGKEQVIALVRSWRKCGDINWIIFHLSPYKEQKQYPVRNEKSMRSRDNVSRLLNPKDSKIIFSFGPKVWESAGSVLNKLFCLAFSLFFYKGGKQFSAPLPDKIPSFPLPSFISVDISSFFSGKTSPPGHFARKSLFWRKKSFKLLNQLRGDEEGSFFSKSDGKGKKGFVLKWTSPLSLYCFLGKHVT